LGKGVEFERIPDELRVILEERLGVPPTFYREYTLSPPLIKQKKQLPRRTAP
jgi:hypothetical protein